MDDIFDDGLWDALNKGSTSGHYIEVDDPTPEKGDSCSQDDGKIPRSAVLPSSRSY